MMPSAKVLGLAAVGTLWLVAIVYVLALVAMSQPSQGLRR